MIDCGVICADLNAFGLFKAITQHDIIFFKVSFLLLNSKTNGVGVRGGKKVFETFAVGLETI